MKKIGILGGIGPEASIYFYSEIIRRLRERGAIHRNADYPQIIITSINAPELVSMEVTDEMLAPYVGGIKELALLKPECIIMACNTIHLFRDRLIKQSGYTNISDISLVVATALEKSPGTICVLGTAATVTSDLYALAGRDFSNPDENELKEIGEVVVSYNATGEMAKNKEVLLRIAENHRNKGAGIFIAGCTEVSELLRGEKTITLIDTLELLIEDTLHRVVDRT